MAKNSVSARDRARFAAARERGAARLRHPSAVSGAQYDRNSDAIALTFLGGGIMIIPRRAVPGLEAVRAPALESISVSPAGDALSWPALDVDVYVPGLVERAFGTKLFAAATGRRGGRKKSAAKAAAARRNGAKGGRPRKRISTALR